MKTVTTGREWGGGVLGNHSLPLAHRENVVHIHDIKPLMSGPLSSHAVSLVLGEAIVALQNTESEQTFKSFFNHPLFIQEVPWPR